MLRVAIDARPLAHPHTGIGRYLSQLLKHLHAEGDLRLFLYGARPDQIPIQGPVVRSLPLPYPRALSHLAGQIYFPVWAARDRIDVFWSPRHHLPLLTNKPCILTVHDTVAFDAPQTLPLGNRLLEWALMRPSINKARRIVAVSNYTKGRIEALCSGSASRLSTSYEASFLTPAASSPRRGDFILFVGTLQPRKNLSTLLRAYQAFAAHYPNPKPLVIAGAPTRGYDLVNLVNSLEIAERVRFVRPDDTALAELYDNCDFVVLPSIDEGFGLPIVEAMAYDKPVIAANAGALPEIGGGAGLYFDPDQPTELARLMQSLSDDPELYLRLSRQARMESRRFSWQTAAAQLTDLFKQCTAVSAAGTEPR